MPLYFYSSTDCGHSVEKFFHSFEESKARVKCKECGGMLGRVITGDNRVWVVPLKNRLKRIFTKWNNKSYSDQQQMMPNSNKYFDLGKKKK